MTPAGRKVREVPIGACRAVDVETRAGGVQVLRSTVPLGRFAQRSNDRLEYWAGKTPETTLAAKRLNGGDWQRLSYAEALAGARSIGEALLQRGLSVERPVAILSDNDLDHLLLALGCLWVGIPYTPVSSAYSLVSTDFAKLRHILGNVTPGLVFASDAAYAKAIVAAVGADVEVVLGRGTIEGRKTTAFAELRATPGDAEATAHAAVGADTVVKFLFTSGSTKNPKGVVNTQRMWCASQEMLRQTFAFVDDEPPVLVDWLPWNHTFGGNHNLGLVLFNGGTLYIDDGKPTASGMQETLRNLREIAPTIYFNVPKGFEEIASAMERDDALREMLFSRVRLFFYSGAGLAQPVWNHLDALAERTVGERIAVMTGLGMTETAPTCTFATQPGIRSGHIGLPCPGVEVKLVPTDGKTEIRFRGPNVMPGYWRAPEQTAEAFDDEGYYRTGDAVVFVDPADPQQGLAFDGRIAEDFKLSSGTFVSVGPLRAKIMGLGAPYVQDAVVTGLNRDEVGILLFPRIDECRKLGDVAHAAPSDVLNHPAVRAHFQQLVDELWRSGTGSANRVARAMVLAEPPSIDRGEITDKGSINQRAVLTHRADLVEAIYRGDARVLTPRKDAQ